MSAALRFEHCTQVALAGDWHADERWALFAIESAAASGVSLILHVGDFGWWPREAAGLRFLRQVNLACESLDIDVVVSAGNHEDWWAWDFTQTLFPRITLLPRTSRILIGGRSIVTMAGAASVDHDLRVEGESWFREEMPTAGDVQDASQAGECDVLITHDAPLIATTQVALARARNPMNLTRETLDYSLRSAEHVQNLADAVHPLLHVHGHWHMPGSQRFPEAGERRAHDLLSLGMNRQRLNVVTLDLQTLKWSELSV